MARADLTLLCDCGTSAAVAADATWTCPGCSTVHAAHVPDGHEAAVAAVERGHRLRLAVAFAGVLAACLAPALAEPSAMLLGPPAAIALWAALVLPLERRRRSAAIAALPGWRLTR